MKKTCKYIFFLLALVFASCNDLAEMNVDPKQASPGILDPNYFLSASQWQYVNSTTGYQGPILLQSGWVQILASTSTLGANYYSNMDKYVPSSNINTYSANSWEGCYRAATLANEAITLVKDKPDLINLKSAAEIMIVLNMQYITDLYGDCPYSKALQIRTGEVAPAYDKQEDIYPALLDRLDKAISAFDASKAALTADLIYKGDIAKWKKFGNSLMLRMAMRLVRVDPAIAKKYAEKAATGGTFASSADDALVASDNAKGYGNGYAGPFNLTSDTYEVRWSKKFIDYLKGANDPRLSLISEVPQDGLAANQKVGLAGNSSPADQLGLPNGFDLTEGPTSIINAPGFPGVTGTGDDATPIGKYSRPTSKIYSNLDAPTYILTYAQTELLLADAVVRGFAVGGTAAAHYQTGVVGAMLSLAPYGITISATDALAYATANPLDVSSILNSLDAINTQYWATCGSQMNFAEAWNNWRRSGFPSLTPINFTGNFSGGTIPRRQLYPTSEGTLNKASYSAAVSRLSGGDAWTSKVWWDK